MSFEDSQCPAFVYVVSAGRSGQASFSKILQQAYPNAYVAFEEPQIKYLLPKCLSWPERKLRRTFIETDELLGRGKVLTAFARNDQERLRYYGLQKHNWLKKKMAERGSNICFEVNKHFLHGLHAGLGSVIRSNYQLVSLVRDPLLNMRSYLNRKKDFYLDNNASDCEFNEIVIHPSKLSKGQLYLHAWFECYLRAEKFAVKHGIKNHVLLTQDLTSSKKMHEFLKRLGFVFEPVLSFEKTNTNKDQGFVGTFVTQEDIKDAIHFIELLTDEVRLKIPFFQKCIEKHISNMV